MEDGDDDDPHRLWCYCLQPDDGRKMIFCDSCEYWYHCDCLCLDALEIDILSDDDSSFSCFKCSGQPPPFGDLPSYPSLPPPSYSWNDVPGSDFSSVLNKVYDEAIHWRHNLFSVPVGKAGCRFVHELSRLFQSYVDCSSLEGIALNAATLMPILLLQKPHFRPRSKDDARVLDRWLKAGLRAT